MQTIIGRSVFMIVGIIVFVCLLFTAVVFITENITNPSIKSVTADELLISYSRDETNANQQYLNKIIKVYGKVSEIGLLKDNQVEVTLTGTNKNTILCTLKPEKIFSIIDTIQIDDEVLIQGNCIGYLNDVYLNNCTILSLSNINQNK
jgi:tRNA_anti-like